MAGRGVAGVQRVQEPEAGGGARGQPVAGRQAPGAGPPAPGNVLASGKAKGRRTTLRLPIGVMRHIPLLAHLGQKTRRYPIKLDEDGWSARRRAFDLFDQGMRPSRAAPLVGISPRTAYRYFQDWKKRGPSMEVRYKIIKAALKSGKVSRQRMGEALAEGLRLDAGQVLEEMDRPWGLWRLLSGRVKP